MLISQFSSLQLLKEMTVGCLQEWGNHPQRALARRAQSCNHQLRWPPQGRRLCMPPRIPRSRDLKTQQGTSGLPCGKESLRDWDGAPLWKKKVQAMKVSAAMVLAIRLSAAMVLATKVSATAEPPARAPSLTFLSLLGSMIKVTMFAHLQFFTLSCLCRSVCPVCLLSVCPVYGDLQLGFEGSPCVGRHALVNVK